MTMLFPRAKFKRTRALADIEALQSQANAHFLELVLNLVGHLSYNQALQYIYIRFRWPTLFIINP